MPQMEDLKFTSLLNQAENDAVTYSSEFMDENEELLKGYLSEPYGDEDPEGSHYISSDIADTVDSDMVSMVRVFLGSGTVSTFQPNSQSDEEIEEAEQKTKYADHLIRKRPGQYKIIHDWIKDAEIQKFGAVKYSMVEDMSIEEVSFGPMDDLEIEAQIKKLKDEDKKITKVEAVTRDDGDDESSSDITLRVTRKVNRIDISGIPTESFLITKNARSKNDATMVGDTVVKKRGELVAEGFSEKLVNTLPESSGNQTNFNTSIGQDDKRTNLNNMKDIRFRDQGGFDQEAYNEWANQKVRITNLYIKIDFDGDGIAERRFVMKSGNVILTNEAFDHVPYSIMSPILMPHNAIGRSRAELVAYDQRVKSTITQNMLDNIYSVGKPRTIINEKNVDIDDMAEIRLNGIVRTRGIPSADVMQLKIPYVGGELLQVIQYMDSAKGASVGTQLASQGLEADNLHRETATRFDGVERASEGKIELIARNYAETGFRDLAEGVIWMAQNFQDTEQEISVLGKSLKINPGDWKFEQFVNTSVGLGSGKGEGAAANAQAIVGLQNQLLATGSVLVDPSKQYNAIEELMQSIGQERTDRFFNNPEVPEEVLFAQNIQLQTALQNVMAQLEQLSNNPLAEAEEIKGRIALINNNAKMQVEVFKGQEQSRQFNIKTAQDQGQFNQEHNLDIAEFIQKQQEFQNTMLERFTALELKHSVDLPGGLV